MENIIKKAIEGEYLLLSLPYESLEYKRKWLVCTLKSQYQVNGKKVQEIAIASVLIDPLFWQALGKACGWGGYLVCPICFNGTGRDSDEPFMDIWQYNAIKFHEINLTQGWDKAVEYLEDLIIIN
jgi:stalled ribosome alternative rescue factor ArfA